MLVRESASSFQLGDHGTTLGGNPLVAAAALATLRVLEQEVVIENARAMGTRFADGLASLVSDGLAVEIRGRGLMIGIETAGPTAKTAMAIARVAGTEVGGGRGRLGPRAGQVTARQAR